MLGAQWYHGTVGNPVYGIGKQLADPKERLESDESDDSEEEEEHSGVSSCRQFNGEGSGQEVPYKDMQFWRSVISTALHDCDDVFHYDAPDPQGKPWPAHASVADAVDAQVSQSLFAQPPGRASLASQLSPSSNLSFERLGVACGCSVPFLEPF